MDATAGSTTQRADSGTDALSAGLLQELGDLLLQARDRIQHCLTPPLPQPEGPSLAGAHAPPVRQPH